MNDTPFESAQNRQCPPDILEIHAKCAEFFHLARLASGKSIEQLAQFLGVPCGLIEKYEQGQLGIPLDQVFRLSQYLAISRSSVMELLHDLNSELDSTSTGAWIRFQHPGELIRTARQNLDLDRDQFVQILARQGRPTNYSRISDFECCLERALASDWMEYSEALHLSLDWFPDYSRWAHLARVQLAVRAGRLGFSPSSRLRNALADLDRIQSAQIRKLSVSRHLKTLAAALGSRLKKFDA